MLHVKGQDTVILFIKTHTDTQLPQIFCGRALYMPSWQLLPSRFKSTHLLRAKHLKLNPMGNLFIQRATQLSSDQNLFIISSLSSSSSFIYTYQSKIRCTFTFVWGVLLPLTHTPHKMDARVLAYLPKSKDNVGWTKSKYRGLVSWSSLDSPALRPLSRQDIVSVTKWTTLVRFRKAARFNQI